jgi:hypothetical protein
MSHFLLYGRNMTEDQEIGQQSVDELAPLVRHLNVKASTIKGNDVVRHLRTWRRVRSVMTIGSRVCIALETEFSESRVVWEVAADASVMVRTTS